MRRQPRKQGWPHLAHCRPLFLLVSLSSLSGAGWWSWNQRPWTSFADCLPLPDLLYLLLLLPPLAPLFKTSQGDSYTACRVAFNNFSMTARHHSYAPSYTGAWRSPEWFESGLESFILRHATFTSLVSLKNRPVSASTLFFGETPSRRLSKIQGELHLREDELDINTIWKICSASCPRRRI